MIQVVIRVEIVMINLFVVRDVDYDFINAFCEGSLLNHFYRNLTIFLPLFLRYILGHERIRRLYKKHERRRIFCC